MADLLGIECGATRTVALFEQANEVQRAVFGPANLRLLSDRQLAAHLRKIAKAIDLPEAVTIGMAGARTTADKKRLLKAAVKVWPKASHIHATNDLETALAADTQRKPLDRVLVLIDHLHPARQTGDGRSHRGVSAGRRCRAVGVIGCG